MAQNYGIPLNAGDVFTYTGVWPLPAVSGQSALLQAVEAILQNEPGAIPFLYVSSYEFGTSGVVSSTLANLVGGFINVTLQVYSNGDFGDVGDAQSLVDNAVYQATGSEPTASTVTAVNGNATGQQTAASLPNPANAVSDVTQSVGSAVSSFFSGLGATGTLLSVGVAIIVILILLAVFAPEAVVHSASVFA